MQLRLFYNPEIYYLDKSNRKVKIIIGLLIIRVVFWGLRWMVYDISWDGEILGNWMLYQTKVLEISYDKPKDKKYSVHLKENGRIIYFESSV